VPALRALRQTAGALTESPVLFVGGLVAALVVAPQTALGFAAQLLDGPLGGAAGLLGNVLTLVTFFVTPAVVAGVLGMAREALDEGETSLATFGGVARARYVSMLGAFVLRVGITVVLGLAALAVVVVGLVVALLLADIDAGAAVANDPTLLLQPAVVAVALLTALVALLVFYGPLLFLQFFAVAVATDGAGAVEGYKRSYRLVRRNVASTLGYSAVRVAVSLAVALPPLLVAGAQLRRAFAGGFDPAAAGGAVFSPVQVAGLTAFVLAAQVVVTPFQHTYARAFYAAADTGEDDGDTEGDDDTADADEPEWAFDVDDPALRD